MKSREITLEDTVEGMLSDDYAKRFDAEVDQLKIRIEKLEIFLKKYLNNELDFIPNCSYDLLDCQLMAMKMYYDILNKRKVIENK